VLAAMMRSKHVEKHRLRSRTAAPVGIYHAAGSAVLRDERRHWRDGQRHPCVSLQSGEDPRKIKYRDWVFWWQQRRWQQQRSGRSNPGDIAGGGYGSGNSGGNAGSSPSYDFGSSNDDNDNDPPPVVYTPPPVYIRLQILYIRLQIL
jgi:hypothetical protein